MGVPGTSESAPVQWKEAKMMRTPQLLKDCDAEKTTVMEVT